MATTLAPEDVEQLWIEFKQDMSNQELRNRLVEMYLPLVKYNGERIWARLPDGVELGNLTELLNDFDAPIARAAPSLTPRTPAVRPSTCSAALAVLFKKGSVS